MLGTLLLSIAAAVTAIAGFIAFFYIRSAFTGPDDTGPVVVWTAVALALVTTGLHALACLWT